MFSSWVLRLFMHPTICVPVVVIMHVNLNSDISYCCRTLVCAFLFLPTVPAVALHYCQGLLVRKLHSVLFGPINWLERATLLGSLLTVHHQPSFIDVLNKPELCCAFQRCKFLFLSWTTCTDSSYFQVFHFRTTKGEKTLCSQLHASCCTTYCPNYCICIFAFRMLSSQMPRKNTNRGNSPCAASILWLAACLKA